MRELGALEAFFRTDLQGLATSRIIFLITFFLFVFVL